MVSTKNVVDGPAEPEKFPSGSDAVPEAKEIPSVPFPVQDVNVTVRVLAPEPLTATAQLAVPVVFFVMFAADRVTLDAPE